MDYLTSRWTVAAHLKSETWGKESFDAVTMLTEYLMNVDFENDSSVEGHQFLKNSGPSFRFDVNNVLNRWKGQVQCFSRGT